MIFIALSFVLFAHGGVAQFGEIESCDPKQLDVCVKLVPRTPIGLPRSKEELDAHCRAYNIGMTCMDAWIKRCLPTDGQKILQKQIGGGKALMRYLCTNESAIRREFIKEQSCWAKISPHWSQCVDDLQSDVREIGHRTQQLYYVNSSGDLCCARDEFMLCVVHVSQPCPASASTLLRKMAWVLAQDIACNQPPTHAYCSATLHVSAPLLILYAILLYLGTTYHVN